MINPLQDHIQYLKDETGLETNEDVTPSRETVKLANEHSVNDMKRIVEIYKELNTEAWQWINKVNEKDQNS